MAPKFAYEEHYGANGNPKAIDMSGDTILKYCTHQEHITMANSTKRWKLVFVKDENVSLGNDEHNLVLVEAMLIQSRGIKNDPICSNCAKDWGPFRDCMSLKGFFGGACGNCKRNGNVSGQRGCSLNKDFKGDENLQRQVEKEKEQMEKEQTTRSGRVSKPPQRLG